MNEPPIEDRDTTVLPVVRRRRTRRTRGDRSGLRRVGAVAAVALAAGTLVAAGATTRPAAIPPPEPVDETGRTVAVCPAAPVVNVTSATRGGELTTRALGQERATTLPGARGATLSAADPLVVTAEGRQSIGSAAAAFAANAGGPDRGLALARCGPPVTVSWFTGLYAGGSGPGGRAATRSEVVLVNADSASADVDLRILGPTGQVPAPGGRGVTVPGRSTRVVALESLVAERGALGVQVRASRGRIHASVRQRASFGPLPGGVDWQVPAVEPSTVQVVPGVPDGPGERTLVLTNPGERRTTARVEVLGRDGTFAPAESQTVDVNAASTAQVSLTRGLAQEAAAVRITTDQPVTAAVVAHSSDDPAASDVAVQPAAERLGATAIGAFAVARDTTGAVVVTNAGTTDTVIGLRLVSTDGRELKAAELPVRAGATALWEVAQIDQPAGVIVRTPRGATTHAGIVVTSSPGGGLATTPLSAPEPASADLDPEHVPGLGGGR